ncbi:MAG TPA: TlpA disulfide reductase family protein [Gaiellaceae bacterium]|nr:TlpA disulfide reductase family protein [Gaiellaceae bacterium]
MPSGRASSARALALLLRALAIAGVAALLAVLVWRVTTEGSGTDLVAAVERDEKPQAPGFDLAVIWPRAETWPQATRPAIADGRLSLEELRGYPVVINFWASWCIPCKAEARRLTASASAHAGEVAFLGIDIQDFKSDARRFLAKFDTNYVSVRDGGDSTYRDYGLTGIPETYYLDGQGRIVAHSLGEVSRRELEAGIAQIASTS